MLNASQRSGSALSRMLALCIVIVIASRLLQTYSANSNNILRIELPEDSRGGARNSLNYQVNNATNLIEFRFQNRHSIPKLFKTLKARIFITDPQGNQRDINNCAFRIEGEKNDILCMNGTFTPIIPSEAPTTQPANSESKPSITPPIQPLKTVKTKTLSNFADHNVRLEIYLQDTLFVQIKASINKRSPYLDNVQLEKTPNLESE